MYHRGKCDCIANAAELSTTLNHSTFSFLHYSSYVGKKWQSNCCKYIKLAKYVARY